MPDVDTPAARSTARAVAWGAAYNYLAQILTVVVQLGYAAVTSRLLPDHDFGVYGAAFTSMLLVNLLAIAGLPQTVGRMVELGASRLTGLLVYALVVGVVAAAALAGTADLWAALWGTPQSAAVIRVLAITSFITPVMSLATGLAYRLGRFRHLAVATFLSNVAGMIVGVVAVAVLRVPEALAISTILGQAGVTVVVLAANRRLFRGRPTLRGTLTDVGYSVRVMTTGLLTYAASNVGRITFSRVFGAAALGQWNRADALTTTPFYQLQAAMLQAIYPEFRHDRSDAERAKRVWTDLIAIVAWGCVPLGAFAAVVSPYVVDVVLGPGWGLAGRFAPVLAVIGGISVSMYLLVLALESAGAFRWAWTGHGINLACNVAGAVVAALLHAPAPLFAGIGLGMVAMHVYQVTRCTAAGMVDGRRLVVAYSRIVVCSALVALGTWLVVLGIASITTQPWLLPAVVVVLAIVGALLWRNRRSLWPVQLVQAYGLLQRRTAESAV